MTCRAMVLAVLAFMLLGCTTPSVDAERTYQTYLDQTEGWIAESKGWMTDFQVMAPRFPRPLPQLKADSAFRRHIAALEEHRMALLAAEADLEDQHASLSRSHVRLRDAYRNMVSLVERGVKNSGPEFAEDEPH